MAVNADIEWKIEQAFINVLSANADLASASVRRFNDASIDRTYPAVVVMVSEARDEEWSVLADYQRCIVDVMPITYLRDDLTGSAIKDLLGACRDTMYSNTFVADLNALVGLHVWGATIHEPGTVADEDNLRARNITLIVHASATDIAEESSSSSSST